LKKGLLILIILATIGIVHAQNVNIPDAIFKAVLVGNTAINTNGDTEIQVSEAAAFGGTIFCASLGISDLTGIEAFTALTVLNCSSNLITSLDVSQNTALTSLNCAGDGYVQGQITSLDVSLNTALTEFYCFENQLDSLNISQNSALTTLWCYENDLDSLNVSQNPALTTLWCSNNQLTSLDLSQNTSLGDLNCAFNQLTYLDVANGNNTNMNNFYANNNPILFCIDVDDVAWSTNNWTNISAQTYFSANCSGTYGCTDSLACNYDPLATINDSSCVYPVIWQQAFVICTGDSVVVGSNTYNTAGNYTDTLNSVNGCDSIIYTNISITPPAIWQQSYSICDGDSIVVGSTVYNTAGNYTDTLTLSSGCDSIVYTNIVVDQHTSSYDTLSVTASIVWNGMPLTISGDYSVTLINSVGCDSIVNLNLTINTTGILDITNNKSNLVKITDMLGQETPYRKNVPLFYLYDDGTVERKLIIE